MKLIDLLVKELPARGGWPEGAKEFRRHGESEMEGYFYGEGGGQISDDFVLPWGTFYQGNANGETITREQYEAATSKPEIGVKHDSGKFRFSLLPWNAVKEVIDVLEFGAKKYAPDNWKRVDDHRDRYFNATIRHVTAWYAGEKNDPETGLNHLAHAVCCLLFLIWFDKNEQN